MTFYQRTMEGLSSIVTVGSKLAIYSFSWPNKVYYLDKINIKHYITSKIFVSYLDHKNNYQTKPPPLHPPLTHPVLLVVKIISLRNSFFSSQPNQCCNPNFFPPYPRKALLENLS